MDLADICEVGQRGAIGVPAGIGGERVALEHPLEQADDHGAVPEDEPVLRLVTADDRGAELLATFGGDWPNLAKLDYVDRVNRAIDHVTANLDEPLRLEDVARVAGFSPYHFHRTFQALVGETLHDFTTRIRLERAVYLMAHRDRPKLTGVALAQCRT